MTGERIVTDNDQMVGVQGLERITVLMPTRVMSPAQAIRHAAWLVAMAEIVDPSLEGRFAEVLKAVQNT